MRLSDYDGRFFSVVRDGSFDTLGILVSRPDKPYLCFAEAETWLVNACNKEDVSCIICTPQLADLPALKESGKGIAVCDSPRTAFYVMHNWLCDNDASYAGNIGGSAVIGNNCRIHETAVIEDGVRIGDNAVIEEYAVIRSNTVIGDNVTVRAGAVVGSSSQIACHYEDGTMFLVKQAGGVRIGNDVLLGYHSITSKGMFPYENTSVGDHSFTDYGVMIAHNSQVGRNTMVLANAQICGSTNIGDNVRINPGAVVSNCLEVGDNSVVTIGSVAVGDVSENETVSGNFAVEHSRFMKWHLKKLRETR